MNDFEKDYQQVQEIKQNLTEKFENNPIDVSSLDNVSSMTSQQVADLLNIKSHEVDLLFDYGMIGGYTMPGTLERFIVTDRLKRFLSEVGINS